MGQHGMFDLEKVNKIGGIPTTPLSMMSSHHEDSGAVFRRGRYRRTRSVADAMSAMQNDGLGATFVLTTGDNSYKSAGFNDDSFTTLKQEMISKVQLPWFLCLGNHDVTDSGWEWHVKHAQQHDSATDNQCHCPAPAYTLTNEITGDFLTIMVVNTNKLKKGGPDPPLHPHPNSTLQRLTNGGASRRIR